MHNMSCTRATLLVATAVACVGFAAPVSAREAGAHSSPVKVSVYAVPLSALNGRCLAQYLADHQAGVLDPAGV